MKLLAFDKRGRPTLAVHRNATEIVDLSVAAPELPSDVPSLLEAGADALARAEEAASNPNSNAVLPTEGLTYHLPVWNARRVICVGLNYADHAAEANLQLPTYPILFLRTLTSLVPHGSDIIAPAASEQIDYEAEMVAVIGKPGRHIAADVALDHVAFYSIANEGSVRDYQFKSATWASGKNFDRSGSFGPCLVSSADLPVGGDGLAIRTRINGETLQDSSTSEMVFKVPALVAAISEVMTVLPGDVIVSGTPAGVGFVRKPPRWMKPGDNVEIEIEGIGLLRNQVVAEN